MIVKRRGQKIKNLHYEYFLTDTGKVGMKAGPPHPKKISINMSKTRRTRLWVLNEKERNILKIEHPVYFRI